MTIRATKVVSPLMFFSIRLTHPTGMKHPRRMPVAPRAANRISFTALRGSDSADDRPELRRLACRDGR